MEGKTLCVAFFLMNIRIQPILANMQISKPPCGAGLPVCTLSRCETAYIGDQNSLYWKPKRPGKRNGGCRQPISARNQCTLPQNKSFFDACQCKICTTFHVKPSLASHYGNAPFSSYLPTNHGQLAIRGDFGTPTPAIFNISVPQKL